jgi:hypothetical protein
LNSAGYLRLAVVRLVEDFRAVVRFLGLRAAVVRLAVVRFAVVRLRDVDFRAVLRLRAPVVRLRPVDFRDVDFRVVRFRVVAAFLAARDLAADFRFRVAAAFLAAVERFRDDVLRAVDLRVVRLRVVLFRAVAMVTSLPRSGRHALQASSFPLAHASPHAVPLVATQRVVEALDPNRALGADTLRLARRSSLLREENLRVEVPASPFLLPRDVVVHVARSRSLELHSCNSGAGAPCLSRPNDELFVSAFEGVVDNFCARRCVSVMVLASRARMW